MNMMATLWVMPVDNPIKSAIAIVVDRPGSAPQMMPRVTPNSAVATNSGDRASMDGSTVRGNETSLAGAYYGGGVYVRPSCHPTFFNTSFLIINWYNNCHKRLFYCLRKWFAIHLRKK